MEYSTPTQRTVGGILSETSSFWQCQWTSGCMGVDKGLLSTLKTLKTRISIIEHFIVMHANYTLCIIKYTMNIWAFSNYVKMLIYCPYWSEQIFKTPYDMRNLTKRFSWFLRCPESFLKRSILEMLSHLNIIISWFIWKVVPY